jgi:hypothetical protein
LERELDRLTVEHVSRGRLIDLFGLERPRRGPPFVGVVRPDDLVVLEVGWTGMHLAVVGEGEGEERRSELVLDGSSEGVLIVRLPPQAIEEDAFFETAPGYTPQPPTPIPTTPAASDLPVGSRIAAASRLAFTVPAGTPPILFTVAGLLDAMAKLPLRVHPNALPRRRIVFFGGRLVDQLTDALAMRGSGAFDARDLLDAIRGEHVAPQPPNPIAPIVERIAIQLAGDPGHLAPAADGIHAVRLLRLRAQSQAVIVGRASEIDQAIDLSAFMWRFRAPTFDETALEVPTKLVLSPHSGGAFVHEPDAVRPPGNTRVDLWHSRLETRTPGGGVSEDAATRTVRAVWARSGAPLGFPLRFGEPDGPPPLPAGGPPYVSLDVRDRYDLVHLTSDFSKRWAEPDPVDVNRLLLSSLGAWLDSLGRWNRPDVAALSEWRHLATMARDHYVRVVYEGVLFPFGHRVALIKITERKFHATLPGNAAMLRQRIFIAVRQHERRYAAPGIRTPASELYERGMPFTWLRLRTSVTPLLDPPNAFDCQVHVADTSSLPNSNRFKSTPPPNLDRMLFWPMVANKLFRFEFTGETPDGEHIEFAAPAIFGTLDKLNGVDTIPRDVDLMEFAALGYAERANGDAARAPLRGQRLTLAPHKVTGDTTFAVESVTWNAHVPRNAPNVLDPYDADVQTLQRPRFFPTVPALEVNLPAHQVLTGATGAVEAKFAAPFLAEADGGGLGGANKGEVLLEVTSGEPMDFSNHGDKAGGLAQPSFTIAGVSRSLGPISGAGGVGTIASGTFDPTDFFAGGLGPKLFGVIPLSKIIGAVTDLVGDAAAVPKFVAQSTSAIDGLSTALHALDTQAQALKALPSIPAALTAAAGDVSVDVGNVGSDLSALGAAALGGGALDTTQLQAHLGDLTAHLAGLDALPDTIPGDVRLPLRTTADRVKALLGTDVATFAKTVAEFIGLLDELTLRFDWRPHLQEVSVFVPERDGVPAALLLSVEATAKSRIHPEPSLDVTARLTDFTVELIKGAEGFLRLRFNKLEFLAPAGKKPDVNVEFAGVEFIGCLSFVEALRSLIPLDAFSDPPALTVGPEGVAASYSLSLPNIAFGVFSLQNLSLGAGFSVPFVGKPVSVRFNFCERPKPFLLTVSAFGGGGYFLIEVDPGGVQKLEAGFEFGASLAMNFGVASGEVHVMGGFVYAMVSGNASLTGYLRIGGEVEALGIITVSIELVLELHYEFSSGKCVGRATLTVEVEVCMFSVSVEISCERKFAGSSGDPTFEQIMAPLPSGEKPWDLYCDAFASD